MLHIKAQADLLNPRESKKGYICFSQTEPSRASVPDDTVVGLVGGLAVNVEVSKDQMN